MIDNGASLIASGTIGAAIKIIAAILENRAKLKQQQIANETARLTAHTNARIEMGTLFYGENGDATRTRATRRILAIMFVATFCSILGVWAWYPTAEIVVYEPTASGKTSLLWGLIAWQAKTDHVITLTTGALVWAALHPLTMILTAYFMPIGSR